MHLFELAPRRAAVFALTLLCAAANGLGVGSPARADFDQPSMKCGSFTSSSSGQKITYKLLRNHRATCSQAKRVMRQFWTGRKKVHHIDGQTDNAHTYYTLPGQRGWKCGTGAGDGNAGSAVCSNGTRAVGANGFV